MAMWLKQYDKIYLNSLIFVFMFISAIHAQDSDGSNTGSYDNNAPSENEFTKLEPDAFYQNDPDFLSNIEEIKKSYYNVFTDYLESLKQLSENKTDKKSVYKATYKLLSLYEDIYNVYKQSNIENKIPINVIKTLKTAGVINNSGEVLSSRDFSNTTAEMIVPKTVEKFLTFQEAEQIYYASKLLYIKLLKVYGRTGLKEDQKRALNAYYIYLEAYKAYKEKLREKNKKIDKNDQLDNPSNDINQNDEDIHDHSIPDDSEISIGNTKPFQDLLKQYNLKKQTLQTSMIQYLKLLSLYNKRNTLDIKQTIENDYKMLKETYKTYLELYNELKKLNGLPENESLIRFPNFDEIPYFDEEIDIINPESLTIQDKKLLNELQTVRNQYRETLINYLINTIKVQRNTSKDNFNNNNQGYGEILSNYKKMLVYYKQYIELIQYLLKRQKIRKANFPKFIKFVNSDGILSYLSQDNENLERDLMVTFDNKKVEYNITLEMFKIMLEMYGTEQESLYNLKMIYSKLIDQYTSYVALYNILAEQKLKQEEPLPLPTVVISKITSPKGNEENDFQDPDEKQKYNLIKLDIAKTNYELELLNYKTLYDFIKNRSVNPNVESTALQTIYQNVLLKYHIYLNLFVYGYTVKPDRDDKLIPKPDKILSDRALPSKSSTKSTPQNLTDEYVKYLEDYGELKNKYYQILPKYLNETIQYNNSEKSVNNYFKLLNTYYQLTKAYLLYKELHNKLLSLPIFLEINEFVDFPQVIPEFNFEHPRIAETTQLENNPTLFIDEIQRLLKQYKDIINNYNLLQAEYNELLQIYNSQPNKINYMNLIKVYVFLNDIYKQYMNIFNILLQNKLIKTSPELAKPIVELPKLNFYHYDVLNIIKNLKKSGKLSEKLNSIINNFNDVINKYYVMYTEYTMLLNQYGKDRTELIYNSLLNLYSRLQRKYKIYTRLNDILKSSGAINNSLIPTPIIDGKQLIENGLKNIIPYNLYNCLTYPDLNIIPDKLLKNQFQHYTKTINEYNILLTYYKFQLHEHKINPKYFDQKLNKLSKEFVTLLIEYQILIFKYKELLYLVVILQNKNIFNKENCKRLPDLPEMPKHKSILPRDRKNIDPKTLPLIDTYDEIITHYYLTLIRFNELKNVLNNRQDKYDKNKIEHFKGKLINLNKILNEYHTNYNDLLKEILEKNEKFNVTPIEDVPKIPNKLIIDINIQEDGETVIPPKNKLKDIIKHYQTLSDNYRNNLHKYIKELDLLKEGKIDKNQLDETYPQLIKSYKPYLYYHKYLDDLQIIPDLSLPKPPKFSEYPEIKTTNKYQDIIPVINEEADLMPLSYYLPPSLFPEEQIRQSIPSTSPIPDQKPSTSYPPVSSPNEILKNVAPINQNSPLPKPVKSPRPSPPSLEEPVKNVLAPVQADHIPENPLQPINSRKPIKKKSPNKLSEPPVKHENMQPASQDSLTYQNPDDNIPNRKNKLPYLSNQLFRPNKRFSSPVRHPKPYKTLVPDGIQQHFHPQNSQVFYNQPNPIRHQEQILYNVRPAPDNLPNTKYFLNDPQLPNNFPQVYRKPEIIHEQILGPDRPFETYTVIQQQEPVVYTKTKKLVFTRPFTQEQFNSPPVLINQEQTHLNNSPQPLIKPKKQKLLNAQPIYNTGSNTPSKKFQKVMAGRPKNSLNKQKNQQVFQNEKLFVTKFNQPVNMINSKPVNNFVVPLGNQPVQHTKPNKTFRLPQVLTEKPKPPIKNIHQTFIKQPFNKNITQSNNYLLPVKINQLNSPLPDNIQDTSPGKIQVNYISPVKMGRLERQPKFMKPNIELTIQPIEQNNKSDCDNQQIELTILKIPIKNRFNITTNGLLQSLIGNYSIEDHLLNNDKPVGLDNYPCSNCTENHSSNVQPQSDKNGTEIEELKQKYKKIIIKFKEGFKTLINYETKNEYEDQINTNSLETFLKNFVEAYNMYYDLHMKLLDKEQLSESEILKFLFIPHHIIDYIINEHKKNDLPTNPMSSNDTNSISLSYRDAGEKYETGLINYYKYLVDYLKFMDIVTKNNGVVINNDIKKLKIYKIVTAYFDLIQRYKMYNELLTKLLTIKALLQQVHKFPILPQTILNQFQKFISNDKQTIYILKEITENELLQNDENFKEEFNNIRNTFLNFIIKYFYAIEDYLKFRKFELYKTASLIYTDIVQLYKTYYVVYLQSILRNQPMLYWQNLILPYELILNQSQVKNIIYNYDNALTNYYYTLYNFYNLVHHISASKDVYLMYKQLIKANKIVLIMYYELMETPNCLLNSVIPNLIPLSELLKLMNKYSTLTKQPEDGEYRRASDEDIEERVSRSVTHKQYINQYQSALNNYENMLSVYEKNNQLENNKKLIKDYLKLITSYEDVFTIYEDILSHSSYIENIKIIKVDIIDLPNLYERQSTQGDVKLYSRKYLRYLHNYLSNPCKLLTTGSNNCDKYDKIVSLYQEYNHRYNYIKAIKDIVKVLASQNYHCEHPIVTIPTVNQTIAHDNVTGYEIIRRRVNIVEDHIFIKQSNDKTQTGIKDISDIVNLFINNSPDGIKITNVPQLSVIQVLNKGTNDKTAALKIEMKPVIRPLQGSSIRTILPQNNHSIEIKIDGQNINGQPNNQFNAKNVQTSNIDHNQGINELNIDKTRLILHNTIPNMTEIPNRKPLKPNQIQAELNGIPGAPNGIPRAPNNNYNAPYYTTLNISNNAERTENELHPSKTKLIPQNTVPFRNELPNRKPPQPHKTQSELNIIPGALNGLPVDPNGIPGAPNNNFNVPNYTSVNIFSNEKGINKELPIGKTKFTSQNTVPFRKQIITRKPPQTYETQAELNGIQEAPNRIPRAPNNNFNAPYYITLNTNHNMGATDNELHISKNKLTPQNTVPFRNEIQNRKPSQPYEIQSGLNMIPGALNGFRGSLNGVPGDLNGIPGAPNNNFNDPNDTTLNISPNEEGINKELSIGKTKFTSQNTVPFRKQIPNRKRPQTYETQAELNGIQEAPNGIPGASNNYFYGPYYTTLNTTLNKGETDELHLTKTKSTPQNTVPFRTEIQNRKPVQPYELQSELNGMSGAPNEVPGSLNGIRVPKNDFVPPNYWTLNVSANEKGISNEFTSQNTVPFIKSEIPNRNPALPYQTQVELNGIPGTSSERQEILNVVPGALNGVSPKQNQIQAPPNGISPSQNGVPPLKKINVESYFLQPSNYKQIKQDQGSSSFSPVSIQQQNGSPPEDGVHVYNINTNVYPGNNLPNIRYIQQNPFTNGQLSEHEKEIPSDLNSVQENSNNGRHQPMRIYLPNNYQINGHPDEIHPDNVNT